MRSYLPKAVRFVGPTLVVASFVASWQLAASSARLHSPLIPSPSAIGLALFHERARLLLVDIPASLRRVACGVAIGCAGGFGAGLVLLFEPFRLVLRPVIEALRPIPPVAWIPLSLIWFGFGDAPAYFLVSLGAFFPMVSATYLGFNGCEPIFLDAGKTIGLRRWQLFFFILLPQAMPSVLSGLRVSVGVAWMVVITAELVGAQSGLGYLIQVSRAQLQSELVLGGMILIGCIGYFLSAGMSIIEQAALPWKRRR